MTKEVIEFLKKEGYEHLYLIPNRGCCAVKRFIFTTGLCYGLSKDSYEGRFCFENYSECVKALEQWNGEGDPSGDWIKHKGISGEYSNPNKNQQQ